MVIKSALFNRQPRPQVAIEHLKQGECKLGCPISIKHTGFKKKKSMDCLIIFYIEYMLK